jgi:hypothetical protein
MSWLRLVRFSESIFRILNTCFTKVIKLYIVLLGEMLAGSNAIICFDGVFHENAGEAAQQ